MKRLILKIFYTLPFILVFVGCTTAPTITSSDYAKDEPEGYTVVSVCYSPSDATRAEIAAKAIASCPIDTNAVEPWDKDFIINDCPILKKNRVTFLCTIK